MLDRLAQSLVESAESFVVVVVLFLFVLPNILFNN